jgi:hypothetical protein
MLIRFTTTPDILYRAQREMARHVTWMRVAFVGTVFVFPLLMLALGFLGGGVPFDTWFRRNGWLVVGLPLFFLFGLPLIQRRSAVRLWKATPTLQGEMVYYFTPTGFQQTTPHSCTDMTWSSVVRVVETKQFVLLFLNKMTAQFLPKDAFNPEELADFRALVSSALGARAEVKQSGVAT